MEQLHFCECTNRHSISGGLVIVLTMICVPIFTAMIFAQIILNCLGWISRVFVVLLVPLSIIDHFVGINPTSGCYWRLQAFTASYHLHRARLLYYSIICDVRGWLQCFQMKTLHADVADCSFESENGRKCVRASRSNRY